MTLDLAVNRVSERHTSLLRDEARTRSERMIGRGIQKNEISRMDTDR